jgi:hypothetical protein
MLHAPVPDGQPSSLASIHAQPSSALCVAPSMPTEPLATHDVVDGLAPTLDPIPGNDADETFVLPMVAADMSGACSFHVSIIGAVHSSASSADGSPAKSTLDHPPPPDLLRHLRSQHRVVHLPRLIYKMGFRNRRSTLMVRCNTPATPGLAVVTPGSPIGS